MARASSIRARVCSAPAAAAASARPALRPACGVTKHVLNSTTAAGPNAPPPQRCCCCCARAAREALAAYLPCPARNVKEGWSSTLLGRLRPSLPGVGSSSVSIAYFSLITRGLPGPSAYWSSLTCSCAGHGAGAGRWGRARVSSMVAAGRPAPKGAIDAGKGAAKHDRTSPPPLPPAGAANRERDGRTIS